MLWVHVLNYFLALVHISQNVELFWYKLQFPAVTTQPSKHDAVSKIFRFVKRFLSDELDCIQSP